MVEDNNEKSEQNNDLSKKMTDFLNSLGIKSESGERNAMYEKSKRAIIQKETKKNDEIFKAITENVGDKLNYASSKYFVMNFMQSMDDGKYAIFNGLKYLVNLDINGLIEKFGGDIDEDKIKRSMDISDLLAQQADLKEQLSKVEKYELYVQKLSEYSLETKMEPSVIVNSPKEYKKIIVMVEGSFENYKERVMKLQEEGFTGFDKIKMMAGVMPIDTMISTYMKKIVGEHAKEFKIDIDAISKVIGNYVEDLILVTGEYFEQSRKHQLEEMIKYEQVE